MTAFPVGARVALADLADDPYPVLAELREHEPVTWAPALGRWLVTPRELVLRVLRDPQTFTTASDASPIRATFGPQMLSTDGGEQRRHRAPLSGPFRPRVLRDGTEAAVAERVTRALGPLRAGGGDLAPFAAEVAVGTVVDLLGLAVDDLDLVRAWYEDLAASLANVSGDADVLARGREAAEAVRDRLLASARHSALLRDGLAALGPDDLGANGLLILFGGIETTESMILNACWAILTHPAALTAAREDPADAIEESLRWEPAVQTLTRFTTRDVTLDGVDLPAGATVECMVGAANRDPSHFADPDRFDPGRPNARDHLTFGHGRHACIGMHLARLETRLAVRAVLELPSVRLRGPARPHGHEFRKVRPLPVAVDA